VRGVTPPLARAGGHGPYLAPAETIGRLHSLGVAPAETLMTWPNKTHTAGDLATRATFAIPLGPDDLTHVGYLFAAKDGPTVYFTGDTGWHDLLAVGAHGK
jgi:L-ascorbate metabolism protein UlaG (beta-lactamase superfamily)